jgi:hypothetical protein
MQVPYLVSIASPSPGSWGSSTSWTSFQFGASIVMVNLFTATMIARSPWGPGVHTALDNGQRSPAELRAVIGGDPLRRKTPGLSVVSCLR